jgi:hypothetical protein
MCHTEDISSCTEETSSRTEDIFSRTEDISSVELEFLCNFFTGRAVREENLTKEKIFAFYRRLISC